MQTWTVVLLEVHGHWDGSTERVRAADEAAAIKETNEHWNMDPIEGEIYLVLPEPATDSRRWKIIDGEPVREGLWP